VGPNGAGKTTTLRCLAGLIPATNGDLNVAGCDLSGDLLQLKRRLAYVPDDPPLFDDLTVGQHLGFIGKLYGVQGYVRKASELLDHFELADKTNAGATTLSRGMRQKLAICCAYLFDPQVLLLDEPLTGLDPAGIRSLLASIQTRAAAGATVIISSHLLAMIEEVCTHLLMMQRGRVQYFGGAEELRQRFPDANSLEEAYFAATLESSGAEFKPIIMPPPPMTIPIESLRSGVQR
jgi:ABC-2 type transport system ATP-binding protein